MWHEVNVLNDVSFEEATKEVRVLQTQFLFIFFLLTKSMLVDSQGFKLTSLSMYAMSRSIEEMQVEVRRRSRGSL